MTRWWCCLWSSILRSPSEYTKQKQAQRSDDYVSSHRVDCDGAKALAAELHRALNLVEELCSNCEEKKAPRLLRKRVQITIKMSVMNAGWFDAYHRQRSLMSPGYLQGLRLGYIHPECPALEIDANHCEVLVEQSISKSMPEN